MTILGNGVIVGYAAFFRMNNGFEKFTYWRIDEVRKHAARFSKSVNNGPWATDFDKMALKTIIKAMLSTYGMLSIEMQTAIVADQAVIKDADTMEIEYVDAPSMDIDKEEERAALMLKDCTTPEEVHALLKSLSPELADRINADAVDKLDSFETN
jgi:recombination protein RecT